MKIFELHFNPQAKNESPDLIFDSFCYEPKNSYEKKLGALYIVGELKNVLPRNIQFLNNLAQIIKSKFYSSSHKSQQSAFEVCLEKANGFLSEELSKENVSWLGNLCFAILSLAPQNQLTEKQLLENPYKQWWKLQFTKVSSIKAILIRNREIIDLARDFELEDIEPYPLKVFTKTISGKIIFGDKIIILTKDVFEFLSNRKIGNNKTNLKEGNLLNQFSKTRSFNDQTIREILKPVQNEIAQISGTFLLIDTEQDPLESPSIINFQRELEKFSIKEIFKPTIQKSLLTIKNISLPKIKIIKSYKIKTDKNSALKNKSLFLQLVFTQYIKKNLFLIISLFLLLIIGFFIFQNQEKKQQQQNNLLLTTIEEKILEAESFLKFQNEERAETLFKETLLEIEPLTKEKETRDEATRLKESILQNLQKIYKLEIIQNQNIISEINQREFSPQKLIHLNNNLYLFNNSSNSLREINLATNEQKDYQFPEGIKGANLATAIDNNTIVFLNNNTVTIFNNLNFSEPFSLTPLTSDAKFIDISSYQRNLYLLQENNITKYSFPLINNKDAPQLWVSQNTEQFQDAKSMSIDSSIWIVSQNNEITRYHNGTFQENLQINIFPEIEKLTRIFTQFNVPYLYLSEPTQNRIIVLEKTGKIIKQFQLEESENIKDFTVSQNGKTIYLLTNQKIYQLTI